MKGRHYAIVVVVVLFSVTIWITVSLGHEYQTTLEVPVVFVNLPDGQALRPSVQRSITFQARGTGWQLATLSFSSDLRFVVDFLGTNTRKVIDVDRELAAHLQGPMGIKLLDPQPDTVGYVLERYTEKTVPIEPVLTFEFREGYGQVGRTVIRPEHVRIGGARSLVATITAWPTQGVRFTDVKSDLNVNVPLADTLSPDISRSEATVTIDVKVQPFAERTFPGVPIEVTSAPPNREVILIPPKMDIVVRGGIDQLAGATASDFRAMVDYRVILLDTTGTVQPEMTKPDGIEVIVRKPDRFQYIIRRRL